MIRDMVHGLYQPRWRRMKEKPPAKEPHPMMKTARVHVKVPAAWPQTAAAHRVDWGGRP